LRDSENMWLLNLNINSSPPVERQEILLGWCGMCWFWFCPYLGTNGVCGMSSLVSMFLFRTLLYLPSTDIRHPPLEASDCSNRSAITLREKTKRTIPSTPPLNLASPHMTHSIQTDISHPAHTQAESVSIEKTLDQDKGERASSPETRAGNNRKRKYIIGQAVVRSKV
jgi:hypothetical protein